MRQTSISDNGNYPQYCYFAATNDNEFCYFAATNDNEFCYFAATNDNEFVNFKRNTTYNAILEHVNAEQGSAYLEVILSDCDIELTDEQWQIILLNDALGNPRTSLTNSTTKF